jgi:hypothetical protein
VTEFERQGLGRNEKKMKPYGLHLILTPKRRCFGFFFFFFCICICFYILYSYKYLYYYIYLIYICSRLSVTAFLKPLKPLTATDLFGYRFLITDYKIGYRFVGYRLSVIIDY